jgi:hypothetical protein
VDLSAFPPAALLRWDLAARLLLAVTLPVALSLAVTGEAGVAAPTAAMSAALVSLSSLGPDLSSRTWSLVAAVGVPVAIVLGAVSTGLAATGSLLVFGLFTVHGAMIRVGLLAQLAWFPVGAAGMLASLLFGDSVDISDVAAGAVGGAVLALLLMWLVPKVIRAPRLAIPSEALHVDTDRLRRMVTAPRWRDWVLPLALGGLSAALLIVTNVLTGGFKPYWAVLAYVSVLAPSSAQTRRSAVETALSAVVGVLLAGVVLGAGMSLGAMVAVIVGMGVVGAVLTLRNGLLSKALLTPLPVVIAAAALDVNDSLVLPLRLAEYVVGAGLGLLTVAGAEFLGRHLSDERDTDDELVG